MWTPEIIFLLAQVIVLSAMFLSGLTTIRQNYKDVFYYMVLTMFLIPALTILYLTMEKIQ